MKNTLLCILFLCFAFEIQAATVIGNPDAPKGGRFVIGMGAFPKSLLFYLEFGDASLAVGRLVQETLLDTDPNTREDIPLVAKSWEISKDKKTFTFQIDEHAQFSDGKPVTAEDVKFTFDTVMNPKNKTVPFQGYLANLDSVKIVSPLSIQFVMKSVHFENLQKVGGMPILAKHFYSAGNFNKKYNWTLYGSGPYIFSKVIKGDRIELKRNPKYWASQLYQNKGRYNFDEMVFKTHADPNVLLEMLKKGDIDYFNCNIAKMWATQMEGEPFQKNYIQKTEVRNKAPRSMQFIGWNLRKPLFQDKKVRLALAHLMDRDRWIRELFYNQYEKSISIFANNSDYHNKKLKSIDYDPTRAKALLEQAGWSKIGSDGIRTKGKERFEFTVLISSQGSERFLTMYQEDLKKMGIKMNIRYADWATSLKLMHDFNFEAKLMARSRGIDPSDLAVVWGSEAAKTKGSANYFGFTDPKVDTWSSQVDMEFEKSKRIPILQQVEAYIHDLAPIAMAWEPKFDRVAHWNKFGHVKDAYQQYSDWKSIVDYWWFDKEKSEKLTKAIASKQKI